MGTIKDNKSIFMKIIRPPGFLRPLISPEASKVHAENCREMKPLHCTRAIQKNQMHLKNGKNGN
jgi:hypothetical protein